MGKWKISFPINGLHDVIRQKGSEINIDDVIFHYRGDNERVGTVIMEKHTEKEREEESKYLINKSLEKICFAFNTEASVCFDVYYYMDLTADSNQEKISKLFPIRYSYVKEDPNTTLAKMKSLRAERQDILYLALAYYKL
jgi:hypothetical protein